MRFCTLCDKSVYDLSAMSPAAVDDFLALYVAQHDALPCARLYRRPDGRLLTSQCVQGRRHDERRRFASVAAGVAALAVVGAGSLDDAMTPVLGPDEPFERFAEEAQAPRAQPRMMLAMGAVAVRERETDPDAPREDPAPWVGPLPSSEPASPPVNVTLRGRWRPFP